VSENGEKGLGDEVADGGNWARTVSDDKSTNAIFDSRCTKIKSVFLYSDFVPGREMFLIDNVWEFTSTVIFEPQDVAGDRRRRQQHGDDHRHYDCRHMSLRRFAFHTGFSAHYAYGQT